MNSIPLLFAMASMAQTYDPVTIAKHQPFGFRKNGFRRGNCEVCGKKNVAAGRERGIYLCKEHIGVNK